MVASASEASGPSVANAHPTESATPTAMQGVVANPGVAPSRAVPADVVIVPDLARFTLSEVSAEDAEEAQVRDSFGSRSPVGHERTRSVGSLSTAPPVKRMFFDEQLDARSFTSNFSTDQAVYQPEMLAALLKSNELMKRQLDTALAQIAARQPVEEVKTVTTFVNEVRNVEPDTSVQVPQRTAPISSVSRSLLPVVQLGQQSTFVSKTGNVLPACDFVPCFDSAALSAHADMFCKIKDIRASDTPTFCGTIDDRVHSWLKKLHAFLTAKLLHPMFWINAAQLSMQDSALEWFRTEQQVNGRFTDWDDFVWRVQMRFVDVSSLARAYQKLTTLRQKENQSVSEFQSVFTTLLQDVNYMHSDMHPVWLRKALRADLLLQMSLPPELTVTITMQDLWAAATQAEAVLKEARKLNLDGHVVSRSPAPLVRVQGTGARSTVRAVGSVAASNAARAAAKDFHTPDPSYRRGLLAAANADLPEGAAPQPVCWRCFRRGHTWEACKGTAKYPKSGDCPYSWTVTTQTTKKVGN